MNKLIAAIAVAVLAALGIAAVALAAVPPGQRGYEGLPGNQGGS